MGREDFSSQRQVHLHALQAAEKQPGIRAFAETHAASFNEQRVPGKKVVINHVADATQRMSWSKPRLDQSTRREKRRFRSDRVQVVTAKRERLNVGLRHPDFASIPLHQRMNKIN